MAVTGLLSYAAYNPDICRATTRPRTRGCCGFYLFDWPTRPVWLYRLTQGVHVTLGLTLVPVVLAKLWSVIPKLFALAARALAGAGRGAAVAAAAGRRRLFEFVTGPQHPVFYPFGSFYPAHFYGAWVFLAAFVVHVASGCRCRVARASAGVLRELRTTCAGTRPNRPTRTVWSRPTRPPPPSSRRGRARDGRRRCAAALLGRHAGQSIDGPLREPRCSPRTAATGRGAERLPDQQDRRGGGIRPAMTGPSWRLGDAPRADGISTGPAAGDAAAHRAAADRLRRGLVDRDQEWRGCGWPTSPRGGRAAARRLRRIPPAAGSFRPCVLAATRSRPRSLLALRVNGADLSPGPRLPGACHRPRRPRRAQHQVGASARLPAGGAMRAERPSRVRDLRRRATARYGADPLHLLALLACFALAGYAASRVVVAGVWVGFLVWFVGAAIVHDLVLFPLYSLADVAARSDRWRRPRPRPGVRWPPLTNYLRVPGGLSGPAADRLVPPHPRRILTHLPGGGGLGHKPLPGTTARYR